jgi:hypothetical protein
MSDEKEFDEFKDRFVSDWKRARQAIEHEDNLIHYRLTWLWTSSLALFTPLVWSFTYYGGIQDPQVKDLISVVLYLIPPIGILLSIAVWSGVRAAQKQIRVVDTWWTQRLEGAQQETARHFALTGMSADMTLPSDTSCRGRWPQLGAYSSSPTAPQARGVSRPGLHGDEY